MNQWEKRGRRRGHLHLNKQQKAWVAARAAERRLTYAVLHAPEYAKERRRRRAIKAMVGGLVLLVAFILLVLVLKFM